MICLKRKGEENWKLKSHAHTGVKSKWVSSAVTSQGRFPTASRTSGAQYLSTNLRHASDHGLEITGSERRKGRSLRSVEVPIHQHDHAGPIECLKNIQCLQPSQEQSSVNNPQRRGGASSEPQEFCTANNPAGGPYLTMPPLSRRFPTSLC